VTIPLKEKMYCFPKDYSKILPVFLPWKTDQNKNEIVKIAKDRSIHCPMQIRGNNQFVWNHIWGKVKVGESRERSKGPGEF
jgi:hypothetical protein